MLTYEERQIERMVKALLIKDAYAKTFIKPKQDEK